MNEELKTNTDISFPAIPGVNTADGISNTGGTIETYRQVLSIFCKDVKARLQTLRFILFEGTMNGDRFPEKHLSSFTTQMLALKSACASIGAEEISMEAARLEEAGKIADLPFIWEKLNNFTDHLAELMENINLIFEPASVKPKPEAVEDTPMYFSLFRELAEAIKNQRLADIDRITGELSRKPLNSQAQETLELISDQILMAEFDSAVKTINDFVDKNNK
jgi:HPt (histidine-containing phosphotransfer) domain-containing protein